MGGAVDRAYFVSVDDLRDICDALNDEKREYKLTYDVEKKTVAICYNDGPDDLNAVCFTFPIIRKLCLSQFLPVRLDEGALIVCLPFYTHKQIRKGLYLEDEGLKWDDIADWEKFWPPLEAALIKGVECQRR